MDDLMAMADSGKVRKVERALLELLKPLRPGLRLAGYTLASVSIDQSAPAGELLFVEETGAFLACLLPRLEEARWEIRSERLHLHRKALLGRPLPENSLAALRKLDGLLRKADPDALDAFFRALEEAANEPFRRTRPRLTVSNRVYLRLNEACQFRCIFCNATEGLDNRFMSENEVLEALEQVQADRRDQVVFTGGEPTLVDALPDYVRKTLDLGARLVVIQTNGLRLAEPKYLDAFRGMEERVGFGLSIHAATEAVSREVTGVPNRLETQWRGLENALRRGFGCLITFVATRPSLPELSDFFRETALRTVAYPRFRGVHTAYPVPNGDAFAKRDRMPSFREMMAALSPALDVAKEIGLTVEMCESSALPRCIFHRYGKPEHLSILLKRDDLPSITPTERTKPESCRGCRYDRVCAGVWRRYLNTFGSEEIRAVFPETNDADGS